MVKNQKIDRRRQILDAAVEIISTEGMARATNRRIAEQAAIPLGHITYYFKNKNELLLSTTQRIGDILDRSLADVDFKNGLGPCLASMTQATWKWMCRDPDFQIAIFELSIWHARQEAGSAPNLYSRTLDYLAEMALQTIPQEQRGARRKAVFDIVAVFIGTLDGLFIQRLTNPSGEYQRVVDITAERVMSAAKDSL